MADQLGLRGSTALAANSWPISSTHAGMWVSSSRPTPAAAACSPASPAGEVQPGRQVRARRVGRLGEQHVGAPGQLDDALARAGVAGVDQRPAAGGQPDGVALHRVRGARRASPRTGRASNGPGPTGTKSNTSVERRRRRGRRPSASRRSAPTGAYSGTALPVGAARSSGATPRTARRRGSGRRAGGRGRPRRRRPGRRTACSAPNAPLPRSSSSRKPSCSTR